MIKVKQGLYAYLGVREYFLYDPTGDYLAPPLQGFRLLHTGLWDELSPEVRDDGTLVMESEVLGLELHVEAGNELRFFDPTQQWRLPAYAEANKYAAGEWNKAHKPEWALMLAKKFFSWRRG